MQDRNMQDGNMEHDNTEHMNTEHMDTAYMNTPESKRYRRKFAAAGLAAGLIGGGAAGLLLGEAPLIGASTVAAVQDADDDPAAEAPVEGDRSEEFEQRRREHLAEVLGPLVEDGTIDQSQADAVTDALIEAQPEVRRGHRGRRFPSLEAAAETIGVDREDLAAALRDGSTLAEVAQDNGVEPQAVIDAMVAEANERIDQALEDGRITEERAAEAREGLAERITELVNSGRPVAGEGPGGPGGHGGPGAPQDDGSSDDGGD
ncbi:MAG: hypothetical protein M9942_11790 [Microthrixaceae bacterium]|nr:hypothetical protein [Microthrixaceae bacterium]